MAGNQVLEWFDLDSEIKTANLKNVCSLLTFPELMALTQILQDPLAPPDL